MTDPSRLIPLHAPAIVATLVETLASPDPRAKLQAAKLLLLLGEGQPGDTGRDAGADEAVPAGGLSRAQQERAVELLLAHLERDRKTRNPSATPCPARQGPPGANAAPDPMCPEPGVAAPVQHPGATRASTPCPAATPPKPAPAPASDPGFNPMSREPPRSPPRSPLAAPLGTDPPRGDADPMSRRLWLARNSAEDAFRRPLPQPPDVEPPWPFQREGFGQPYRHRRWR